LLAPTNILASDTVIESEENLAEKSAQAWLDAAAPLIPYLPQWKDADVVLQRPYNGLNGERNSYLFAITARTGIVGWVMVGNSSYEYSMFEASEVMPPSEPTTDEIISAIEKIGLHEVGKEIARPVDFVYTGIGGFYAIYDIGEQTIAINLIQKTAMPVTNLKNSLPSPEDCRKAKKELRESQLETRGSGYEALELSYYQPGGEACGPCAGVSIGQYYREEQGYSDLYNNSDMFTVLYSYMQVLGGAVWPGTKFTNGFVAMTESCEYDDFNSSTTDQWVSSGDYWTAVDYINNGWPTALCIVIPDKHWRAIRGYGYITEMDIYMVYCTDSAALSNSYIINWSNWCANEALSKICD